MRLESKTCTACGRSFSWRKKWERNWDAVKYCSDACRRGKVSLVDRQLEHAILTLLDDRKSGDTICPSEAAKRVSEENWRALMEPARRAARRLVDQGKVLILQRGKVVDPTEVRGPIRIGHAGS